MSSVLQLNELSAVTDANLADLINEAPRVDQLRDAIEKVITGIHGLPGIIGCELQQLEVYVGRSGATSGHLRQRWETRAAKLENVPSLHAFAALRTSTVRLQKERWERGAQLIVRSLESNRALCCSNAITGDSGRWPETKESVIYVVGRARRGKRGEAVKEARVNAAVAELIRDDSLGSDVVREAARLILDQAKDEHSLVDVQALGAKGENDDGVRLCRECGKFRALRGNYGYCGFHRR
jgi:hypothetical protein